MTREVLILRKHRTARQHVKDTLGRFSTEYTKGVIRTIGMGLTCMIGAKKVFDDEMNITLEGRRHLDAVIGSK